MKKFTLIEVLIVIAIVAILFGATLPACSRLNKDRSWNDFKSRYGTELINKGEFIRIISQKDENYIYEPGQESFNKKSELLRISQGDIKLEDSGYFSYLTKTKEKVVVRKYENSYNEWKRYVDKRHGKLNYEEFAIMYENGVIKEFKYSNWCENTGNPKEFTEEQYQVLLKNGMISLYR